jgi:transposase
MPGEDILIMRTEELRKLDVIKKVNEKVIRQKAGADLLGVSTRQMRRLQRRIKERGEKGIIHGNRGRKSPKKISEKIIKNILELRREKYYDFKPTFMSEKLAEEGICISKESLRNILIKAGEWQVKVKKKKHRKWRERKECFGEMVQFDGSHHFWLEDRGPEMVLMKFVDDATSRSYGRFYEYEGTIPAMDITIRYIRKYGIPRQIYADKHTTYKALRDPTIEEQLRGEEPQSAYQRAVKAIGINLINANSPQAKGRVERNFGVDQDRLVKELRLAGICSMEDANKYIESYWVRYNRKFAVSPMREDDLHMQIPEGIKLKEVFREREERTVRNDNAVQYAGNLYQLESSRRLYGEKVYVETDLKGKLFITYKTTAIDFIKINPDKVRKPEKKHVKSVKRRIPAHNHPWRRGFTPELEARI